MMHFDPYLKAWKCNNCDYNQMRKEVVFKHIDSKHYKFQYNCDFCPKVCPTQHALTMHNRTYHK